MVQKEFEYTVEVLVRTDKFQDYREKLHLDGGNKYTIQNYVVKQKPAGERVKALVRGQVFDARGQAIVGQKVQLDFQLFKPVSEVVTDKSGSFVLQNVELISGNSYDPVVSVQPSQPIYQKYVAVI